MDGVTLFKDTISESGGNYSLTVLSRAELEALDGALSLDLAGSTATANGDFTVSYDSQLLSPPTSLPASSGKSLVLTIAPVDDKLIESNEVIKVNVSVTVVVDLPFPWDGRETEERTVEVFKAELTIEDDDEAGISFDSSGLTVDEGSAQSYSVVLDAQPVANVTVGVAISDTSAAKVSRSSLSFTPSNWSKAQKVSVTGVGDDDAWDESVTLRHTASGSSDYAGVTGSLGVTVEDYDERDVVISRDALSLSEGKSATYSVNLSTQPSASVVVTPAVSGSSSVVIDGQGPHQLTFRPSNWSAPQTVTVRAKQDADALDEVATVSHAVSGADYGANGVTADSVKVSVDDDEPLPVTVSFSSSAYEAEEGERATMVTVNLSAAPGRSVPISIVARGRGGASTDDYELSATSLSFGGAEDSGSFTVRATSDGVDDDGESVSLSFGPLPEAVTAAGHTTASVALIDEDPDPSVSLTLSPSRIEEGDSATVTARLSHASSADTTVRISASGVTLSGNPLTIPAGRTRSSGRVTLISAENAEDEPDRRVTVSGKASNSQGVAGDPPSVILTIEDDDELPEASLSSPSLSVGEGGGSVRLTVRLSAASSGTVTVGYATADGTARAGSDYASTSGTLRFSAGDTRGSIRIPITADTVDEPAETFRVTLSSPSNATLGSPSRTTVTITDDDDAPTVSLSLSASSIAEGESATVTARLSHPSSADTTVTVSAPGVTVTGNPLTIPAGDESSSGSVTLASSDNAEDGPDRTVTVSGTATNSQGIAGDPSAVTLTIRDDDEAPTVSWSAASLSVDEGDPSAGLTARLSAASARAITVHYATADDSARAGPDYDAAAGTLTFDAGEREKAISVALSEDTTDEPDETFTVTLSAPTNATLGSPSEATVTIEDNDAAPTVSLSLSAASISEDGSAAVTASLSHPSSAVTEVQVVIGGITSQKDGLTIPAGETASSGAVTLRWLDNDVDEPDASVRVSATVRNAQGVAGKPRELTLTVVDNDPAPTVALVLTPATIAENGGLSAVTARLSHPSSETTRVDVSSTGVAPASVMDFVQSGTALVIPARQRASTGDVTIEAVDNSVHAPDKQVTVSGVARNAQGIADNPPDVTLTIEEDDPERVALTLSVSVSAVAEDAGPVALTVTGILDRTRLADTVVPLTAETGGVTFEADQTLTLILGGTATAGTDYSVTSQGAVLAGPPYALTLTAGASSVQAAITARADSVSDPGETVTVEVRHAGEPVGSGSLMISEGICARTPAVRDALVEAAGATNCAAVGASALAGITALDFSTRNLASLTPKSGDFSGLAGLKTLVFRGVPLGALPSDVFAGLGALELLNLKNTGLSSLPDGVFTGLGGLRRLTLENNPLGSLSAGVFSALAELRELNLRKTRLTELPAGVFNSLHRLTDLNLRGNLLTQLAADALNALTALETLNLISNRLTAVPDGLFEGLTQLSSVRLDGNSGSPIPLKVSLQLVDEGFFRAVLASGAPFAAKLPITVSAAGNIEGGATSITIATGAVYSEKVKVTRKAGEHSAVTVTLGTLPGLPDTTHQGYELAKSKNLPLTVRPKQVPTARLSVADAPDVKEASGATVTFAVHLSPAADRAVTVDYATADGSAKAGDDYRAVSGRLTFAVGETSKTVDVAVIDDILDEGRETFLLKLSNARGAHIEDGEATAAIVNSDPLPQAWLARFARITAGHVADGIGERLMQPEGARSIPFDIRSPDTGAPTVRLDNGSARDRAPGAPAGFGGVVQISVFNGELTSAPPQGLSRRAASTGLPFGRSFITPIGGSDAANRRGWTVWGRGMAARFAGHEDHLAVHGEVTTYMAGADTALGRWRAGVAVARSSSEGGYTEQDGRTERGNLHSTLFSVHPYARVALSERLTAWGLLGYGQGHLMLDRGEGRVWRTGTAMAMAGIGAKGVIRPAPAGSGFELALRTDALYARIASAASENDAGRLAGAQGNTGRLRLMLHTSRVFRLRAQRTLTPTLEVGVRQDTGHAGGGAAELGGGLTFADAARGIHVAMRARARLGGAGQEWGASAAVRLDPDASGRGLMLRISPAWGLADGNAEGVWAQHGGWEAAHGAPLKPHARLNAEIGYALNGPMGQGRQMPYAAVHLAGERQRTLTLGWRLQTGTQEGLSIETMQTHYPNANRPDYGIRIRGERRW